MIKGIRAISILVVLGLVGAFVVFKALTISIPIGAAGVRTQEYALFGKKGVVTEDFGPGWHRNFGPIDSWVVFDSTVQTLEMTRDPKRGSMRGRDDVQVQSADGYAVSVDITVKFRIMDGQAHKLYQDTGSGTKYKTIVKSEAQNVCMRLFGQMETEDFYDPEQRREKAAEAHARLSESLKDNFVEVIAILIRDVQFDPEYEGKIRTKKLADQEVELNKSMANAEKMKGKTQVIEAETGKLVKIITKEKEAELVRMQAEADLEVATITAEAEKYATEKKADADLEAAQKEAEGTLLVKTAEAEGEKARNLAMEGVGGSMIAALEAAKNLNLTDLTISTVEVDLLDLDAMATKLGAPEKGE